MKKLLMVNECSQLNTGYSIYGKELLSRLHSTNKYEIAELACYIGAGDKRLNNIPWKVFPNLPEKNGETNNLYEQEGTHSFGEYSFDKVCLEFKPDIVFDIRDFWMCTLDRTLIITNNNVKKIVDIDIDDLVLTHTGKYKKVVAKFVREYNGDLYSIQTSNCTIPIDFTEKHPIYRIKRQYIEIEKHKNSIPEWVGPEKLEHLDILLFPIDDFGNGVPYNKDICRLFGYWAAEGCIMYEGRKSSGKLKGIQFTLNKNEIDFITDISKIIKDNFDLECNIKNINNSCIIRCYGNNIAQIMLNNIGELSGCKSIEKLMSMDKNQTIHFLCGLFRGDGGIYKKRSAYNTKSKQLAYQVFRLCLRLGILASFGYNKNSCEGKIFYRYPFSFNGDAKRGFDIIYNLTNEDIPVSYRIYNKYAYLTIKKITKQYYSGKVYNIEVEDDNSYVTSFAVHNCEHQSRSPFRNMFRWNIMPTVDAYPQQEQWIHTFASADAVLTYTDWSGEILKQQMGNNVKWFGSASPAASHIYKPLPNRKVVRSLLGMGDNVEVIGTVMRNQKRKLYPELFDTFRKYIDKYNKKNTILYCHVSYPDNGWDIPALIKEFGLSSKVFVTYICSNPKCGFTYPSTFSDVISYCPKCRVGLTHIPNVNHGVSNNTLMMIYNMFDLYVQYANSEGFGMPQVEAAACGVPVAATDYSAMSEIVRKLKGYPIAVHSLTRELETGCNRARPSDESLMDIFTEFFEIPAPLREIKRNETRRAFEENYSWDKTAEKWQSVFDRMEPAQPWNSPPRIFQPEQPTDAINHMNNLEYARWLIINVLREPEKIGTYFESRIVRDLNYTVKMEGMGGLYYNEQAHMFNKPKFVQFTRETAYKDMVNLCNRRNQAELARSQIK